jgi:hypothetical protein
MQGPVEVRHKALIFVLGDVPFARCVKSPARSRAFPAAAGFEFPKLGPSGLRQREFSAAPALRCAETGPRRFHKAPPGTSPITRILDFDGAGCTDLGGRKERHAGLLPSRMARGFAWTRSTALSAPMRCDASARARDKTGGRYWIEWPSLAMT